MTQRYADVLEKRGPRLPLIHGHLYRFDGRHSGTAYCAHPEDGEPRLFWRREKFGTISWWGEKDWDDGGPIIAVEDLGPAENLPTFEEIRESTGDTQHALARELDLKLLAEYTDLLPDPPMRWPYAEALIARIRETYNL